MTRTLAAATLISALCIPAAFAGPQTVDHAFTFKMTYDPAKVSTADGADEVYKKLYKKVKSECERGIDRRKMSQRYAARDCIRDTMDGAIETFNMDAITRRHEEANAR